MPNIRLGAYAKSKGWTRSNVADKIRRGTITERALIRDDRGDVLMLISEIADKDLAERGDPVRAAAYQASKAKKANVEKPVENVDEDDWLGAELGELHEKGTKDSANFTKKAPIAGHATQKTDVIDGQPVTVNVVPPAADDYGRFRDAKTSKEEFAARKLELEIAETEGRLLDTEGVRKRIVKRVSETKDALTNLAAKIAPVLVGITDVVEMETTLQKEITAACAGLYELGKTRWNEDDNEERD